MKSLKCPQCGLTNWETAEWCKRCKTIIKATTAGASPNATSFGSDFNQSDFSDARQTSYSQANTNAGNYYASGGTSGIRQLDAAGFLVRNIERCNRNLMIVCILLIFGVFGGFFMNFKYLCNVALGAYSIEHDKLLFDKNLPSSFRNYVKVNVDKAIDTGGTFSVVSKYNVETVKSKYFALAIGGKLLLAEVDPDGAVFDGATNIPLTGELVELTPKEDEKILQPILRNEPELRSSILSFKLKAKSGYSWWAYTGSGVGLTLLLISGLSLLSVLGKIGNPEKSSVIKSLKNYGSPIDVAGSIDAEIKGQHDKIGPIYILPNWIIRPGTFSIEVINVEDIVWIYKKVTKHSVNFIPTGKTYEVVLHNSTGDQITLNGTFLNEKKTHKILEKIQERIPWVVAGYDDELIKQWKKHQSTFIETVRRRKKSYVGNPGTTSA